MTKLSGKGAGAYVGNPLSGPRQSVPEGGTSGHGLMVISNLLSPLHQIYDESSVLSNKPTKLPPVLIPCNLHTGRTGIFIINILFSWVLLPCSPFWQLNPGSYACWVSAEPWKIPSPSPLPTFSASFLFRSQPHCLQVLRFTGLMFGFLIPVNIPITNFSKHMTFTISTIIRTCESSCPA